MIIPYKTNFINKCRPPRGGRGLKFDIGNFSFDNGLMSPPSRGAWIEIEKSMEKLQDLIVAPLAGGVD